MLADLATGFVTLLLLPLLGVIGLLQKRAIPLLAWTLGLWAAFGTWALLSEHTFAWSRERFLRGWLLGLGLGAAFLLIAWLRTRPAVKPWIKVSLSALTVAAFARALVEFVERYG